MVDFEVERLRARSQPVGVVGEMLAVMLPSVFVENSEKAVEQDDSILQFSACMRAVVIPAFFEVVAVRKRHIDEFDVT